MGYSRLHLLGLASLLWSGAANAQVYLQTEAAGAYVPIANLPGIGGLTPIIFSGADEGTAIVPIPFDYSYLGQSYTEVEVGVNGVALFGNAAFPGYFNEAVGTLDSDNNTISIWWDDLVLDASDGHADFGLIGSAPNRILVIEVRDWEHYGLDDLAEGTWQLWLYEGPTGRFEVHYGGTASAGEGYSASVGWEGRTGDGVPFGLFRPCGGTADCDEADYATLSGRVLTVELAEGPELDATVGLFPRGARPGDAVTGPITVRNVGTQPSGAFASNLLLSTDTIVDANDRIVGSFNLSDLAAGAEVTVTATVTVPAGTPPADYYLLVVVDAANAVAEPAEGNNVAIGAPFATAAELQPISVEALSGGNAGQTITVRLVLDNTGVPQVGPVATQLYASRDRALDGNDVLLGSANLNLSGVTQQSLDIPVVLPTLPPGRFYVIARVDPANVIIEIQEGNNTVASLQPFDSGPNLAPIAALVPAGAEPGQPITFDLTIANRGVPVSGPITVRVLASLDPIYDLNDPVLGNVVVTLDGSPTQVIPVTFSVPALAPGAYYPIFRVDPTNQLAEIDETDNTFAALTRFLTGPDLAILDLTTDAEGTPGLPFAVTTQVGSLGAPFNGTVAYRLYVSSDNLLDASDPVMGTYSVTFAGGASVSDSRTPNFPQVPAGRYRILARVDPLGAVAETSEQNNVYVDTVQINSGPDFTIYNVNVAPSTVDPVTPFVIQGILGNNGGPYTGAVAYRVYLSDFSLSPGDPAVFDGVAFMDGVVPVTITATITLGQITPPIQPADYYAYLVADPDNLISERSETNNRSDDSIELLGPNLVARSVVADPVAFLGQSYSVAVTIENSGPYTANDFVYAYVVTDRGLLSQGSVVFTSPPLSLPAGARVTLNDSFVFPTNLPAGEQVLGVLVDASGLVAESNEEDNILAAPGAIRILPLMPDLAGRIVATPTVAAAGAQMSISRTIQNQGPAPGAFAFRYYLSVDEVIQASDIPLDAFSASLAPGDLEFGIDVVRIPASLSPGTYYVGLYLDPDQLLAESDETNNGIVGPAIPFYAADLRVLTATLAPAIRGAPYEAGLYARGGTQGISWSVAAGFLPPGLSLDTVSGIIGGTPQSEGRYPFTARVTSGGATAEQPLILTVGSVTVPLSLPPQSLAIGFLGRPYEARLVGVGGEPPYVFSALAGLPGGILLEANGRLHGTPDAASDALVQVRLRDAVGAQVSGELRLRIADPSQRVLITPAELPTAVVGRSYCLDQQVRLYASGGRPPYLWSMVEGQVPGLSLASEGALCGTPTEAGRFPLVVRVVDQQALVDTAGLTVSVLGADDLLVLQTTLPDAELGAPYSQALTAQGGLGPYQWSLAVGTLPAGLSLAPDGVLSGTPGAIEDAAFVVLLTDARAGSRAQPLSIRVRDPGALEEGKKGCGCSTTPEGASRGASGLWLLLLISVWRRRGAGAKRPAA